MRFRDRYRREHHGHGPVTLWVVIPLLTLVIPLVVLITGIHRRRANRDGMTVEEFGWENMLGVWVILLAFIYLVYIPFLAPARERRRKRRAAE